MTIQKFNLPVITEGGVPNPNNVSAEMDMIMTLARKTTRSNIGQIAYTSPTSGVLYDTSTETGDVTIYNKGETGLYNLLIKEMSIYMITAEDLNTYGTGTIDTTGWTQGTGLYPWRKDVVIAKVTSQSIVNFVIDKESMDIALSANLCATNESYDGGVTVFAKRVPTSSMSFTYTIFK